MTSKAEYKCKRCGSSFVARTADRDRGWARFCSKSCKAIKQTQTKIKKVKSHQRYDKCRSYDDVMDLRNNPRIIEPLYDEFGERDGELFYANFSNSDGSDI